MHKGEPANVLPNDLGTGLLDEYKQTQTKQDKYTKKQKQTHTHK